MIARVPAYVSRLKAGAPLELTVRDARGRTIVYARLVTGETVPVPNDAVEVEVDRADFEWVRMEP